MFHIRVVFFPFFPTTVGRVSTGTYRIHILDLSCLQLDLRVNIKIKAEDGSKMVVEDVFSSDW